MGKSGIVGHLRAVYWGPLTWVYGVIGLALTVREVWSGASGWGWQNTALALLAGLVVLTLLGSYRAVQSATRRVAAIEAELATLTQTVATEAFEQAKVQAEDLWDAKRRCVAVINHIRRGFTDPVGVSIEFETARTCAERAVDRAGGITWKARLIQPSPVPIHDPEGVCVALLAYIEVMDQLALDQRFAKYDFSQARK
jgi:hypothetical protein